MAVEGSARPSDLHLSKRLSSGKNSPADFDVVLQAASAEVDPAARQNLLREWAQSVGLNAMAETLAHIEQVADPELQSAFRLALLSRWTELDAAGAMQAVQSFRLSDAQTTVLRVWAEEDLSEALSWFGKQTAADGLNQEHCELLVRALGQHDPARALSWMDEAVPESLRHDLYSPFFRQWAQRDPAAAASMLLQLADPLQGKSDFTALGNVLLGLVAGQWASADLNSAVAWAQALPEGAAKSEALAQISYRWAGTDPQTAASYASSQNDARMLSNVAGAWAEREPHAAANYAAGLPSGSAQDAAVISVVSVWARSEPMTVLDWVREFSEGPLRERAFDELLGPWAGSDPAGASAWLHTLADGARRDEAISNFVRVIEGVYPESAFQWAATITDEGGRLQRMQTSARAWLTTDPAAAQRGIAQSDLPEHVKNELLGSITPPSHP
ncbi:MAG: hypothetical protein L0Y58_19000 [Verrucomicrobia subdivision 3 bacterium]|nr:hypothetical protein [Limisphaerales bacterium]